MHGERFAYVIKCTAKRVPCWASIRATIRTGWSETSTMNARCIACSGTARPDLRVVRSGWCAPIRCSLLPRSRLRLRPVSISSRSTYRIASRVPPQHRRMLPVHPRDTVSLSPRRTAVGGRPRRDDKLGSANRRAALLQLIRYRRHDHVLGAVGLSLVRGDGTAAGSAAAPVRVRAPAGQPAIDYHGPTGPRAGRPRIYA